MSVGIMNNRYFALLRANWIFRYLTFGQVFRDFGDWGSFIASTTIILSTGGDSFDLVLLVIVRFLPITLFSPLAGHLNDHYSPWKILVICEFARFCMMISFVIACLIIGFSVWVVLIANLIVYSISAFHLPAWRVIVPRAVEKRDLPTANITSNAVWSAMLSLGTFVGGFLASVYGPLIVLFIDAFAFLFSGFLALKVLRSQQTPAGIEAETAKAKEPEKETFLAGVRGGLHYLRQNRRLRLVVYAKFVTSLVHGGFPVFQANMLREEFSEHVDVPTGLGYIYFFIGLGHLVGPFVVSRYLRSSLRTLHILLALFFMISALCLLTMMGAHSFSVHVLATFVTKIEFSVVFVASTTIIQYMALAAYLGRVSAFENLLQTVAVVLSSVLIGVLFEVVGLSAVQVALCLAAVQLAACALFFSIIPPVGSSEPSGPPAA